MVEMTVSRIGMNQQGQALVILGDPAGERLLPIWIGPFEAHAIAVEMQGEPFERPLTHDLFTNTLAALGQRLVRVEITKLEEGVFYALLHITDGEHVLTVDARPSDAIALALRAEARIFVAETVLAEAQVRADDIQDGDEMERFKQLLRGTPLAQADPEEPEDGAATDEPDDQPMGTEDAL